MLVIVEGPDGSGKTTLINELIQSKLYFVLARNSGPPRSVLDIIRFCQLVHTRPPSMPMVCDRHPCISDRIYGPTLRGIDYLANRPTTWMLSGAALIVYCRPPSDVILKNVIDSRSTQLEGVAEKCAKLISEYDRLMSSLIHAELPVAYYDYAVDSSQALIERISPLLTPR